MVAHRAAIFRTPRRRLSVGIAATVLGVTASGIIAATAKAETPQNSFPSERFNQLMSLSLGDFKAQEEQNNPNGIQNTPVKDADNIRWDTDGCSDPTSLTKGAPGSLVETACMRHDVAYRTLQENHQWNRQSKTDADNKFWNDLLSVVNANNLADQIGRIHADALWFGGAWGSELPSWATGIPQFDGSSVSPYTPTPSTPPPPPAISLTSTPPGQGDEAGRNGQGTMPGPSASAGADIGAPSDERDGGADLYGGSGTPSGRPPVTSP